jgi:hypothetical protein
LLAPLDPLDWPELDFFLGLGVFTDALVGLDALPELRELSPLEPDLLLLRLWRL